MPGTRWKPLTFTACFRVIVFGEAYFHRMNRMKPNGRPGVAERLCHAISLRPTSARQGRKLASVPCLRGFRAFCLLFPYPWVHPNRYRDRSPSSRPRGQKGRAWPVLTHSSTVRVAVLVDRLFLFPVDENGGSRGMTKPRPASVAAHLPPIHARSLRGKRLTSGSPSSVKDP
jgi:hypothetical protein